MHTYISSYSGSIGRYLLQADDTQTNFYARFYVQPIICMSLMRLTEGELHSTRGQGRGLWNSRYRSRRSLAFLDLR